MTKGKLWKAKQQWETTEDHNTKHRLKQFIITECAILAESGIDVTDLLEGLSTGDTLPLNNEKRCKTVTISQAEYIKLLKSNEDLALEVTRLKRECGSLKTRLNDFKQRILSNKNTVSKMLEAVKDLL